MSGLDLIKNKYSVSAIILLCCLLADIILHKGMSRVILPSGFTDKVAPAKLPICEQSLAVTEKKWVKAVDNIDIVNKLPLNTAGIECDVYFDITKKCFEVYHDSSAPSILNVDSLLAAYNRKELKASIWFDFKNLNADNALLSLHEVIRLKSKYGLHNKIIVESPHPKYLQAFCDSGFFTSYYVPYFNPYQVKEVELIYYLNSIKNNLRQYPTSALSGYYFQYPVLEKFFPNYPILTWADNNTASLVSYLFNRQLEHDTNLKIILYPFKD